MDDEHVAAMQHHRANTHVQDSVKPTHYGRRTAIDAEAMVPEKQKALIEVVRNGFPRKANLLSRPPFTYM